MGYNRKFFLLCVFLILMLLSGCSKSGKAEKEIIKDLQANPAFISEDIEISNYEIIKRQTDINNKTDLVYITVHADNSELTYSLTYELKYKLYNEGWILEYITRYYDGPWEFAGLSDLQLIDDIMEWDYYFSNWNLTIKDIEVTSEEYSSSIYTFYEKFYNVNIIAQHLLFDYYASYRISYEISDGNWLLENVDTLSKSCVPTSLPSISSVDEIVETLGYDWYEYSYADEDFENNAATLFYRADKEYKLGTEVYQIAIPLSFSAEKSEGSSLWTYSSNKIEESFDTYTFKQDLEGVWSFHGDDFYRYDVDLEIIAIWSAEDSLQIEFSCDAVRAGGIFGSSVYRTDGIVKEPVAYQWPGHYTLGLDKDSSNYFSISLGTDNDDWYGVRWNCGGVGCNLTKN